MAMDKLQEMIRKLKNPTMVDMSIVPGQIPVHILSREENLANAYKSYCLAILDALKGVVPAVRFSFDAFALQGPACLEVLPEVMQMADEKGYYVLLDAPQSYSQAWAQSAAELLGNWPCDGLLVSSYIGSDGLRPYAEKLRDNDRDLFVVIRTANKTAPELQDLMTGGRLVHTAVADMVSRMGEPYLTRCGYSRIGGVGPASAADSLRNLRSKYKGMFLLVEGYDYSNANAKNCSFAFDRLGHGAIVCAGSAVAAPWVAEETNGADFVEQVVEAAERMKKNLLRYTTVL